MVLGLLLVFGFAVYIHRDDFAKPPSGMHTWAQSDHYALAKGFTENNLNFFLPQTYVYNHQFPNSWKTPDKTAVTAVDFPIHNYIPGVVMKLTGSDSPAIFRIYMLLLSFVGLFYLFRLAHHFNRSETLSFLIVVFFAASPVFTFYQVRFIPSIPSLSTAIIGMYYYVVYRDNERIRTLIAAIAFLTLSALSRSTYTIPLLAVFGVEFLRLLRDRKDVLKKVSIAFLAAGLVLGYMLYNAYLRREYGSFFLNVLIPAKSFGEFITVTKDVLKSWKLEYFTVWHYGAVILAVMAAVYRKVIGKTIATGQRYTLLLVFLFTGSLLFYIAMCVQFKAHDYYFADAFFIPLIISACLLSKRIVAETRWGKRMLAGTVLLLAAGMFWGDVQVQEFREASEKWGRNETLLLCYAGSDKLLDQLHVPRSEKILVLNPASPNIPFMEMDRTGYMTMNTDGYMLAHMMRFPVKYVVYQNELFLSEIYNHYPGIIRELEIIGTNGRITVCRKTAPKDKTLLAFLQLENRTPVFSSYFSDTTVPNWEIEKHFNEQEKAFEFTPASDYGPVLKLRDNNLFRTDRLLLFEGELKWNQQDEISFFVSFVEHDSLSMYKLYNMENFVDHKKEWIPFRFLVSVPPSKAKQTELSAVVCNPKKVQFFVRNVRGRLY